MKRMETTVKQRNISSASDDAHILQPKFAPVSEPEELPRDILVGAVLCAEQAAARGEMIPHKEVYGLIKKKLGWK
ncbi:MAG: hypothetical protein LBL81_01745 [Tannerella sp.]|nr:hypothetical protein [Tannerella sp.]